MSLAEAPGALSQLASFLARKGRPVWPLVVAGKRVLTPRMVRVTFSCSRLSEFVWKRGQDLVLELPQADGSTARRHYTIRALDDAAETLAVDFVRHGDSPAGRWLDSAVPGDRIAAVGPRGHTWLRDADWHLFAGDETAIPAIFAMLEGLPNTAQAFAFLEIAEDAERQAAPPGANIVWLARNGARPGPNRVVADAVEAFALPPGRGQAYILGETSAVRAIRQRLIARGLGKAQTCAEGYWRPGRVGGHDHA